MYNKLTKKTMPPIDNRARFILWRGARDTDGGYPVTAAHVQYNDHQAYIWYVSPKGWKVLDRAEYRDCLWTEIETPVQIVERMRRKALREAERQKRKKSA